MSVEAKFPLAALLLAYWQATYSGKRLRWLAHAETIRRARGIPSIDG